MYKNIKTTQDFYDLSLHEMIDLWNEFCDENYWEDTIDFNTEDTWEMYVHRFGLQEFVRSISYGEFNYRDGYVIRKGDGNLYTFDLPSEMYEHMDLDELLTYIKENKQ